jgi:alkylated DNA repair dioxygenase AlkB
MLKIQNLEYRYMIIDKEVYTEPESQQLFEYLDTLEVEYHKQYKRFNQMVKVPRGQASYTLHGDIHYDYKVSGGSPPNHVMTDTLKEITAKVNSVLGTNFNTILLNKYMNGDDCIGFHKDREAGWAPNTGFATLAFGAARDFQVKNDESKVTTTYLHESGHAIYMPSPMNQHNTHCVPKRKRVISCRISLTFREISDI